MENGNWRGSAMGARLVALGALLALLGGAAAPAQAQTWVPVRSGLGWASGANGGNGGMADLQTMRGRLLDMRTYFTGIATWSGLIWSVPGVKNHLVDGARVAVAIGMLPETHRGQHMACWQGRFANEIRAVGTALINAGASNAIIRLGWEANRVNGYPWAVTGDASAYKGCFRKWIKILRTLPGQRFVFDWTMQDKSTYPIDQMYPGDEWVDIIGVNVYDRCSPVRTDDQWNAWYNLKDKDGRNPRGLGTWLAFARQHGKKLSIPEWGIGGPSPVKNCTEPGIDNPFWMRKMFEFFRTNAANIAYEAYFNGHGDGRTTAAAGSHKLAPTYHNPLSAAVYKELWGLP